MVEGLIIGVAGVLAAVLVFVFGASTGATTIANDCKTFGKARIDNVIYVCAPEKQ